MLARIVALRARAETAYSTSTKRHRMPALIDRHRLLGATPAMLPARLFITAASPHLMAHGALSCDVARSRIGIIVRVTRIVNSRKHRNDAHSRTASITQRDHAHYNLLAHAAITTHALCVAALTLTTPLFAAYCACAALPAHA